MICCLEGNHAAVGDAVPGEKMNEPVPRVSFGGSRKARLLKAHYQH
jgi:hypothetical protein